MNSSVQPGIEPDSELDVPPPSTAADPDVVSPYHLLLLGLLAIMWGTTFPAIKVVLGEMPVLTFRAFCLLAGSLGVAAIALWRGRSLAVSWSQLRWLVVLGTFNTLAWNVLTAYGLLYLPAGRAVIIGYTMPLWTVIASALILGERITARKVLGLALGFAGLAVLIGPDLVTLGKAPLGVALMVLAAISWALGVVFLKLRETGLPTSVMVAWQLGLASLPLIIGAFFIDDFSWQMSTRAWLAFAFVVLGAMVIAHMLWFTIARALPASVSSISTLVIPVVGVITGALWLGEHVGPPEIGALVLVISGLFVVLVMSALGRQGKPG
jgi:drug/metabolite transporter (DMT)-like permease